MKTVQPSFSVGDLVTGLTQKPVGNERYFGLACPITVLTVHKVINVNDFDDQDGCWRDPDYVSRIHRVGHHQQVVLSNGETYSAALVEKVI